MSKKRRPSTCIQTVAQTSTELQTATYLRERFGFHSFRSMYSQDFVIYPPVKKHYISRGFVVL